MEIQPTAELAGTTARVGAAARLATGPGKGTTAARLDRVSARQAGGLRPRRS